MDLVPGSGRFLGEETGNPFQYSCLGNSWTEEPGGLQSMGSQRVEHGLATKHQQLSPAMGALREFLSLSRLMWEHFLSDLYYASSHENHPIYLCL